MSDEGFHGGDLVTLTANGGDVVNRTKGRKASVNSFFWQTPDRILVVDYLGGRQRNFRVESDGRFNPHDLEGSRRTSCIWEFSKLRFVKGWQARCRGAQYLQFATGSFRRAAR